MNELTPDDDTTLPVTVEDLQGPMVTGGIGEFDRAPTVWVVLLVSARMGDEGELFEVLDADPGPDYPQRLIDAWTLTRDPRAGYGVDGVEVIEQVVRQPR